MHQVRRAGVYVPLSPGQTRDSTAVADQLASCCSVAKCTARDTPRRGLDVQLYGLNLCPSLCYAVHQQLAAWSPCGVKFLSAAGPWINQASGECGSIKETCQITNRQHAEASCPFLTVPSGKRSAILEVRPCRYSSCRVHIFCGP